MGEDRKRRERVLGVPIWRRGEAGTWYADLRRLGGGRESLGTADRTRAEEALSERKRELEENAGRRVVDDGDVTLHDFCQEHLRRKKKEVARATWKNEERALGYLVAFLRRRMDEEPTPADVTARRLEEYRDHRLGEVKASTVGVELTGISSMLKRAHAWALVERNEARHVRRPRTESTEAVWLETGEAAKVLQAASGMVDDPSSRCRPHFHALIASFLLTGGRRNEVFGLEREDVDLEVGEVRFRPNDHRGLKNRQSRRRVPLWPQLREVLAPYLDDRPDGLLFPAPRGGMVTNVRSALDTLQDRAKLEKRLTPKVFRHTYTATRLQTLDGGEPVSLYTVARELGHKGISRIEDTYGHLQRRRSRLSEVRYEEAEVIPLEERRAARDWSPA